MRLEFDIENPLIVVPTGPESIDISHFVIDLGQMTVKSTLINQTGRWLMDKHAPIKVM